MLISRLIKTFRPAVREVSPSNMVTFILALAVSCFGIFKIFFSNSNGGAEFLGLFGGLLTGHYISAYLYPLKPTNNPKKIKIKSLCYTLFALLILSLSLLGINYFLANNSLDEIPEDAILFGLALAAGSICMIAFNFQYRNMEAAGDGDEQGA